MTELSFAEDFRPADIAAWENLVRRIVKEEAGSKTLESRTRDGVSISAIYPQRHPGRTISTGRQRWLVFQRADHPDPAVANEIARADLEGGADGLEIVLPGSAASHGYGVGIDCLSDLDVFLRDIDLETVPLRIDGGYEVRQAISMIAALIEQRGVDPARTDIVAESDPGNGLLSDGRIVVPYPLASDWGADMVHGLLARGLRLPVFVGEGRAVHAAGGSEVQELTYALAAGVEHIRMLEARQVTLEDAASMVTFSLAADADQFVTMAKLRAFRLVWQQVVDKAGLPDKPPRIHAETAWRMMTRYDPWTNILRNTVAAAAAGLGGADSVLALPFTLALGLPDAFARRVARNSQLVLLEEAGLAAVADPAAGSGYVETLTEQLAEATWESFRRIEKAGGIIEVLRSGRFQEDVLETRRHRTRDAAIRRERIVGTTEFAWLDEYPVEVLDAEPYEVYPSGDPLPLPAPGKGRRFDALVAAVRDGATMTDILATIGYNWERSAKAPWWRITEPFEALRDASVETMRETGRRPSVFLANLGASDDYGPSATFAKNLFAIGGIDSISGAGGLDLDMIVAGFAGSGLQVACICASDAHIAEYGARLAAALKGAGAARVQCALRAPAQEAALLAGGVDIFLDEGCDILSELESVHQFSVGTVIPRAR